MGSGSHDSHHLLITHNKMTPSILLSESNLHTEMLAKRFFLLFSRLLAIATDFPSPSLSAYTHKVSQMTGTL